MNQLPDDRGTAETQVSEDTVASDAGSSRVARTPMPVDRGATIGRYVVLDRLGAGAMGIVLAAFDPELDRKVAIKLLKVGAGASDTARARLQREAQALAKLAHPNVVAVHDVGTYGESVFVAMEHVAGRTLGEWCAAEHRTLVETIDAFSAAGRGLGAAHAAGLVHRDFKPDNVMVGDDGRVRVMDFGLARTEDEGPAVSDSLKSTVPDESNVADDHDDDASITSLTRTGAVLGTPAYMSPEQFAGVPADARSDQFGFCVALWEALYGERPFAGTHFAALMLAVTQGELREPRGPAAASVRPFVRRAITRGLARSPDERWPDMDALLDAIADDPTARRRRAIAGVAVVASLGGGAWAVAGASTREPPALCEASGASLAEVWNVSRADAVAQRIGAAEFSYAPSSAERVRAAMDDWAAAWTDQRRDACEATRIRGEQSETAMDLRMACLDRKLVQFSATADVLAEADDAVARKSTVLTGRLPPLARCGDLDALRQATPPPEDPALAARVDALRGPMARASALQLAGKYDDGLEIITGVVSEAESIGHGPLLAEAALHQGLLQRGLAKNEDAERSLVRAYSVALSHRDLDTARSAARLTMTVVGQILARYDDAHQWAIHARALADASGSESARAEFLANYGDLAGAEGNYQQAFDLHAEALEIRERVLAPDSLQLATSLSNTGAASKALGKREQARAYFERALDILVRSRGPDHPQVGDVLHNLGIVTVELGDQEAGRAYYDRSLAVREAALGPEHPNVALTVNSLGVLAYEQRDFVNARMYDERALRIYEAKFGPEHPSLAAPLMNLANVHKAEGDLVTGRALIERAVAITEKAQGPDHPNLGFSLHNLGNYVRIAGDPTAALAHHQRTIDIFVAAKVPETILAYPQTGKGQDLLDLGRPGDAIEPLEASLKIRKAKEKDRGETAETRFALARALWDVTPPRRDRGRALILARTAADDYASTAEAHAAELPLVQAWLAAHDG